MDEGKAIFQWSQQVPPAFAPLAVTGNLSSAHSLLNANKINCLRVNTFQDLQNLNLLSLYDNKLQTISKGLFAPLQSIQTL